MSQVGQFLLSSGFVDTDEEAEQNCQALAKSLQKVRRRERVLTLTLTEAGGRECGKDSR